jgi:DNA-directed RNA polymerase subunit RPC12/RpoP
MPGSVLPSECKFCSKVHMEHVSGRKRPLWRCPQCGHRFVSKNLWHSCGRYRLAGHFTGKPRILRGTFDRLLRIARAQGPVTVYAQKTRIVFQNRIRFAGAVVRSDWLDVHLWLKRRITHPRIHKIESLGRLGYSIHFRLRRPDEIDADFDALLQEARDLGLRGTHLPTRRRS